MRQAIILISVLIAAYGVSKYMGGEEHPSHAHETAEEHAAHSHSDGDPDEHQGELPISKPVSAIEAGKQAPGVSERDQAFENAVNLITSKSYQAAADALEELLKKYPNDEKALEAMGRLKLRSLDRPQEALTYFQRAAEQNPNNTRALTGIVMAFQKLNDPNGAERVLMEMERKNPNSSGVNEVLGSLYSEKGDFERSNAYFRKAATLTDMPEYPLGALADSLRTQGRPTEAVKTYQEILKIHEKALAKSPSDGERDAIKMEMAMTSMELVDTLIEQGKVTEAERLLDKVRAENSEAPLDELYQKLDRVKGS